MPKAAAADVIMDVNRDYAVPQATHQGDGVWIRANGWSLKVIAEQDGSVNVRAWPLNAEDEEPVDIMDLDSRESEDKSG